MKKIFFLFLLICCFSGVYAQSIYVPAKYDVTIDQQQPNTNFNGQGLSLKVAPSPMGPVYRTICIRFDIPVINGVISNASVIFSLDPLQTNTAILEDVDVYLMTAAWDEDSLTWSGALQILDPTVHYSYAGSFLSYSVEIPMSLIDGWLANPSGNFGLMIKARCTWPPCNGEMSFFDNENPDLILRPYLVLDCNLTGPPPKPMAVIGPDTVCPGTPGVNFSFFPPVSSGVNYFWTAPPGWSSSFNTWQNFSTVSDTTSGNVCVSISNSNGSSDTTCKFVYVEPPAPPAGSITGLQNICEGDTASFLLVQTVPGTPFHWVIPPGWTVVSGQDSIILTVIPWGSSALLLAKNDNICNTGAPASMFVTVEPLPEMLEINGQTFLPPYSLATYTANATDAVYFQWSLPPGASIVSGATTNTVQVLYGNQPGQLCATAINYCGTGSEMCRTISMLIAGVGENEVKGLRTIHIPGGISIENGAMEEMAVSVYSLTGTIQISDLQIAGNSHRNVFLKPGFYILTWQNNRTSSSMKVCITD